MGKRLFHITGFLLLSLLASCQREQLQDRGGAVGFAVSESIPDFKTKADAPAWEVPAGEYSLVATEEWIPVRGADTKAVKLYRTADTTPLQGDPIGVWAYNMASASAATSQWLLDGGCASGAVQASYNSTDAEWKTAAVGYNTSKRAASYYTRWFAVAPWAAIGNGATPTGLADGQAPKLNYQVPASAASQHDLMVASSAAKAINDDTAVPLAFHHVLTAIRIKAPKGAEVTQAVISGVYDKATLDMQDRTWSSLDKSSSTASFTADLSAATTWDTAADDYDFVKDAGILMMIPQWLPDGATLTLTVDGSVVTADLAGHKWEMGKLVTYRVRGSAREYHIELDVEAEIPPAGTATPAVRVHSYSTPEGGGAQTAEPWIVKGLYSTQEKAEAGQTPDLGSWSTTVTSHAGSLSSGEGEVVTVQAPAGSVASATVNQLLAAATPLGTEDQPWNLANPTDGSSFIVESANTYIINAPGWYRIPLVMGNGIKGGALNPSAYPSNFVDYSGMPVSHPKLHKTGLEFNPDATGIVWTESSGMVESLSILPMDTENDLYWLRFRIQPSKIQQGCTVVSVKIGSTVMWSWLLWVTDYEPGLGDVAAANATFMPRNLGWSVEGTITGAKPSAAAFLRIEAENNPSAYAVVRVRRASGVPDSVPYAGHGPYFQWGRKDAFHPSTTPTFENSSAKKPEDLIKNPNTHYGETAYPFRLAGYQDVTWWSAAATGVVQDCATVKTIYDPCPAGYTVPRLHAFKDYSATSWVAEGATGYNFTYSGGTVFLPATGRRKPNNSAEFTDAAIGHYWSAVPQGNGTARRLLFSNGSVILPGGSESNAYHSKAAEHAIRPAREQ